MAGPARLAVAQLAAGPLDAGASRAASVAAARALFEQGADLVVLPELCVPGYVLGDAALGALAEPLEGPTVAAWTALAAEHGGLICGGFAERAGDALFNTAVLVDADGVRLHYRKLHPFAEEKAVFAPGDLGLPVVDTRLGRIGVCVCYDLRFVETVRALALQDADLICVPTAWTAGFDSVRWNADGLAPQAHGAILQANLNQVFIACASQTGEHAGTTFLGSSIVAGPRGELVLGPLAGDVAQAGVVDVDLRDAVAAQQRSPLIAPRADRRTDVYGLRIGSQVL
jgi:N-carbamoylputrescine amidase